VPKFESDVEIGQISADFEKCRFSKVSMSCSSVDLPQTDRPGLAMLAPQPLKLQTYFYFNTKAAGRKL